MPKLRAQAALLTELTPKGQKAIVRGPSLGGPLVAWMAINASDNMCGAVSIAGSSGRDARWHGFVGGPGYG